jgi:hypothetical protein
VSGGQLNLEDHEGWRPRLAVGPETLRKWLIKCRDTHCGTETELTLTVWPRPKVLERENSDLRAETAFLAKATGYLAPNRAYRERDARLSFGCSGGAHPPSSRVAWTRVAAIQAMTSSAASRSR